jgi:septal ring factor EnvC (AmiA/AmiB activator)
MFHDRKNAKRQGEVRRRLSVFRFDKAVGKARVVKALPLLLREKRISKKLRSKRQELRRMKNERPLTADKQKIIEYKKRKKSMQQEIFRLENDLRRARRAVEQRPARPGGIQRGK